MKGIPSVQGGDKLSPFPSYSNMSPMRRAWMRNTPIHEIANQGFLTRQYEYGCNDTTRYPKLSETEGLIHYAKDIRGFWSDFESKMKGHLRLPVFDVHIGSLTNGKPGVIAVVQKVQEFEPSNEYDKQEKVQKCERMWNALIEYLEAGNFYENRIWWDNKEQQFVYGTQEQETKNDQSPEWYLVDIDLITSTKEEDKNVTGGNTLRSKYILSLDCFFSSKLISEDFYHTAKQRIEKVFTY